MNLDNIIGTNEAAEILGLSPDHVKKLCRDGKIPSKVIGKTYIINKLEVMKMKFNQLTSTNSTIIEWEGIVLKTTQDPYLNNDEYTAIAIDSENNEYEITWEINHPDFENLEDESEACDWDNPVSVIKL